MESLAASSVYFYRVGSDDVWSSLRNFTTAPRSNRTKFTVAVFGDMGWLGSKERPRKIPAVHGLATNWSAVPTRDLLESFKDNKQMDMALIVGDISYADDAYDR